MIAVSFIFKRWSFHKLFNDTKIIIFPFVVRPGKQFKLISLYREKVLLPLSYTVWFC